MLEYDFSSVKNVYCGAAPLGFELHEAFEKKLKCKLLQAWGQTECVGTLPPRAADWLCLRTTCIIALSRPDDAILGYNGALLAGMEGRIVNGEMQVIGGNVTPGYWNK
jgi:long-subunit acyl-CoA synthetase (AMP-forming)